MKPENLRILGIDYRVDFEDSEDTNSGTGSCNVTRCIIKICANRNSPDHQKSVLIHEIIEALNYRLELELDHYKITTLEAGLIQVIRDNPKLLEYLASV